MGLGLQKITHCVIFDHDRHDLSRHDVYGALGHVLSSTSKFQLFNFSGHYRATQTLTFDTMFVSTSASDCLERLVSEMTYYVSSGTLNSAHSLTHSLAYAVKIYKPI